jgi:hypothetical protein
MTTIVNRVSTPVIRECAYCIRDHNKAPNLNATHGICRRHAIREFISMGYAEGEAADKADRIAGPTGFCPDLGELQPE